jgi:salicylate hydroxylase
VAATPVNDIVQHADFRRLLYQTAFLYGAKIRRRTRVVAIDSEERSVTLASGEILRADVIIGADGPNSLARQQLLEEEELPLSGAPTGSMMYK